MFGKGTVITRGEHTGHSVLQEGLSICGSLEATGDVRLDGSLEGKVQISERLTIGEQGSLVADVEAGEVVVMGKVKGNILARRRLEIRKGAEVIGDITTPILIVEEGVRFQGHSNMNLEEPVAPIIHLPDASARDARPKNDILINIDS